MSLLKKIGEILVKGIDVVIGFAPLVQSAVPQSAGTVGLVASDLKQLEQIIITVEAIGQTVQAPGADKLKMATPLIAQAILQSSLLVGRQIQDAALFTNGAEQIASGLANVLNSLKADVQTESKAA